LPWNLGYPSPQLHDDDVALRAWALDDIHCVAEASTEPRIPGVLWLPVGDAVNMITVGGKDE
jgi:hypothetical protein